MCTVVILIEKKTKRRNTEDSKMYELRARIAAPGIAQSKSRKEKKGKRIICVMINAQ
jgi:hypothetical protein